MSETSTLITGPNSNSLWQKLYSANGCEHEKVRKAFPFVPEARVLAGL